MYSRRAHLALSASKDPHGVLNFIELDSLQVDEAELHPAASASPHSAESPREQERAKVLGGAGEVEEVGDGKVREDLVV